MKNLKGVFEDFLKEEGLKQTNQRELIFDTFIEIEKHLTAEEIYELVKKKNPKVGYATVYRTLKLLCNVGIARGINWRDGRMRYEHKYRHRHHDHLVCMKCGKSIGVFDEQLEKIQDKLSKEQNFTPTHHELNIFGVCKKCGKR
jgi:Fur family ferric uptake transcriptional regulator